MFHATDLSRNPRLQRKCACGGVAGQDGECKACRKKRESGLVQRRLSQAAPLPRASVVPALVHDVLRSPGQPLDAASQSFMEPQFGHDFSQVRIHADAQADESARAVNAQAFTVGRHIVFAKDRPPSNERAGRSLLAHELTHVVQQTKHSAMATPQFFGGDEHTPAEMEANQTADAIGHSTSPRAVSAHPGTGLHRKVKVSKPADLIPNPTGKGLVQTNAATVQNYLSTLCSEGSVAVDKASGSVKLSAAFCPPPMAVFGPRPPAPADKSKEPKGCSCLCDMVGSANDITILVDDKDWPHTLGRVVTTPSPNSPKLWGAATASGKTTPIDPWLVLGHEFCGHAWLADQGLPDNNATRGEGGHQETVARENELRAEHGLEARGGFKDPYCGESFWREKAGPGPVQWSSFMKICQAWRQKTYGGKYKISDKIP
jgi:hypothetical protein